MGPVGDFLEKEVFSHLFFGGRKTELRTKNADFSHNHSQAAICRDTLHNLAAFAAAYVQ